MIGMIDYGAGNLHSVEKAVKRLGYNVKIITNASEFHGFDKIIFPGVGNARKTMEILNEKGLSHAIQSQIKQGTPFFGICLGMQLLLQFSAENTTPCLEVLQGTVEPFETSLIVPHMGWNEVIQEQEHFIFKDVADQTDFYFVHSYYVKPTYRKEAIGTTVYGSPFTSIIAKDTVIGVQFHPEKSGEQGLQILQNFCSI